MQHVFDACTEEAQKLGLRVTGSEIVGVVPHEALLRAGRHYLTQQGQYSSVAVHELVHVAARSLGLSDVRPFNPQERVIENRLRAATPLADMTIVGFVDEMACDSPAPGGGSAAALAAALSGALSSMVCALSFPKANLKSHRPKYLELGQQAQTLKAASLSAIDDDTKAFDQVLVAMRAVPKGAAADAPERKAVSEAYKHAAAVPLSVVENSVAALEVANQVLAIGLESATSDVGSAGAMARAALTAAAYNVRINLKEIQDKAWVNSTAARLTQLETQGDKLEQSLKTLVNQRLA